MALSAIDNAAFDTLAGAVEAPYGPLTRVTDIDTDIDWDLNSDVKIECTSALSQTLYVSYDELDAGGLALDEILANAHGGPGFNHLAYLMTLAVEVIYNFSQSYAGPPFSDAEWKTLVGAMRYMGWLALQLPNTAPFEAEPDQFVDITVSLADGATTNHGDLTLTIAGDWSMGIIDWLNDGTDVELITPDTIASPYDHDYGGTGAVTTRIVAIGPGGFQQRTATVTIA